LLQQLHKGPITITRRGKPVGMIIDPEEYQSLRQVQAYLQLVRLSEKLHHSDLTAAALVHASSDKLEGASVEV